MRMERMDPLDKKELQEKRVLEVKLVQEEMMAFKVNKA